MIERSVFDARASSWIGEKETPWARMRYEITNKNLRENLIETPRRVLNIGCGDGVESVLLDDFGSEHVLFDYSEAMLNQAKEFLQKSNFRGRVTFIAGSVLDLSDLVTGTFDLVLFHNVIEYIESPIKALREIRKLMHDTSVLSVRHLNRYSNFCSSALYESNLLTVEKYLDTSIYESSFGVNIKTYSGEEIASLLTEAGFDVVQRYGLMTLNNFLVDNNKKYDKGFFEELKRLEIKMSTMFPYYHLSRFGQLICCRSMKA